MKQEVFEKAQELQSKLEKSEHVLILLGALVEPQERETLRKDRALAVTSLENEVQECIVFNEDDKIIIDTMAEAVNKYIRKLEAEFDAL